MNDFWKETHFLEEKINEKIIYEDLNGRIQARSFREVLLWKSTI